MRKILFFSFCFLWMQFSIAQDDTSTIINNTWTLNSFDNECLGFVPGDGGDEFDINNIQLSFTETTEGIFFHTQICASIEGKVEFIDDRIQFQVLETSGESCQDPMNEHYEDAYLCLWNDEFNYELIENENGSIDLTLENDTFMVANFSIENMSISEFSNSQSRIYPNPVQDFLNIDNSESKLIEIQVLDRSGRVLYQTQSNQEKIKVDFNSYPSNVYFLRTKTKNSAWKTEKIIKK